MRMKKVRVTREHFRAFMRERGSSYVQDCCPVAQASNKKIIVSALFAREAKGLKRWARLPTETREFITLVDTHSLEKGYKNADKVFEAVKIERKGNMVVEIPEF